MSNLTTNQIVFDTSPHYVPQLPRSIFEIVTYPCADLVIALTLDGRSTEAITRAFRRAEAPKMEDEAKTAYRSKVEVLAIQCAIRHVCTNDEQKTRGVDLSMKIMQIWCRKEGLITMARAKEFDECQGDHDKLRVAGRKRRNAMGDISEQYGYSSTWFADSEQLLRKRLWDWWTTGQVEGRPVPAE